jgi:transcriptional regulator with XRE-family HTH domain
MDEKEFRKKIGLNIRALRVKKEWKQSDLADFALLDKGSIGKIERGTQNVTISNLYVIAKTLGVEPKVLLEFE